VSLARFLGVSGWMLVLVMLAVVAGHIWPVQLGFHGGKGAATMIGALVGYSLLSALLVLGIFLLLFAILRSFTLSGMLAFALTPLALLLLGQPLISVGAVLALAVIVLIAHRANIRARLASRAATP
jgi:acyl phosphate:glycerol-3-phosphate acyltransferase